jgi:hypothetical protein
MTNVETGIAPARVDAPGRSRPGRVCCAHGLDRCRPARTALASAGSEPPARPEPRESHAASSPALVQPALGLERLADPQHRLARIFAVEQVLGDFVDLGPGRLDLDLWHKQLLLDLAQQDGQSRTRRLHADQLVE